MRQIENKDYAVKYRKEGKRIMLLGVNFDSDSVLALVRLVYRRGYVLLLLPLVPVLVRSLGRRRGP